MNKLYQSILTVFFCILSNLLFAQNVTWVPFRVGNLFGLSDINGRMVVSPRYAMLEPIGKGVFTFVYPRSSKMGVGSNQKEWEKRGVLFGQKEIISNSEFNHFTYLEEGIIVGSENPYTSRNSNFYNLKGEKLLPENVAQFKMIVTDDAKLHKGTIAILAMHKDARVSVLMYDAQKQKMLAPLIDKVSEFKILKEDYSNSPAMVCSYIDQNNAYFEALISYDSELGTHIRKPYLKNQNLQETGEGDSELLVDPNGAGEPYKELGEGDEESMLMAAPMMGEVEPGYSDNSGKLPGYFERLDEGIFFDQKELKIASYEKVYFYAHGYQTVPLIFYNGTQYGLLLSEKARSPEMYDTLIYLHNQYTDFKNPAQFNYLVGNKDSKGKYLYGILNEQGKLLIPMQYESISVHFQELEHIQKEDDEPGVFKLMKQSLYQVDDHLCLKNYLMGMYIVKKDGKFGLISAKNEILLPIVCEQIWKNKINFMSYFPINENLYCYQKGTSYGAFFVHSGVGIHKNTGAIFPKIPLFMYENYMGEEGLDLYNLADESSLRFCLASNLGVVYYKKK